ncbi:MAG: hypothetical protein ACI8V8_001956, partial [Chitinophagales bacterium]
TPVPNKRLKTDKNKSGFYRLIGCYMNNWNIG